MKKAYMQPTLEAIDIKVNTILCASIGFTDKEFDGDNALAPYLEDDFDFSEEEAIEFEEETFNF